MRVYSILLGVTLFLLSSCMGNGHSRPYILSEGSDQIEVVQPADFR